MTLDEMKGLSEEKQKELANKIAKARGIGKSTNYAAVYGSGAETLARTSGMSVSQAKAALEGYWTLNWAVKAIAEDQCTIEETRGAKWLVNPINGFAYSLRGDKDRFSTLCQGTGSFLFDMWVDEILNQMYLKWGVKRLNLEMHDEYVTSFTDTEKNRQDMKDITENAILAINSKFMLRKALACTVQFGANYAAIH